MEFLVCEQQEGEGCDYTIGCGMTFYFMEAESIEKAKEKIVWPDGRDEYSTLGGDNALEKILIIPAEHVVTINVEALKKEVYEIRANEEAEEQEKTERAELERLQAKYT